MTMYKPWELQASTLNATTEHKFRCSISAYVISTFLQPSHAGHPSACVRGHANARA